MKVGIIVAMQKELDQLSAMSGNDVKTVLCGIGKVNAAMCATTLIAEHHPDAVLSVGVSGSMRSDIRQGDIVVANRVAYHDVWCGEGCEMGQVQGLPRYFECHKGITATLQQSLPEAHSGLLVCGDQFYISQSEDERILALYPDALATDMESAAIAQVCHIHHVPFSTVRIVSDSHDSDDSQQNSYRTFWQAHDAAFDAVRHAIAKVAACTI